MNTLWVDKKLKMHGLMQAFSRILTARRQDPGSFGTGGLQKNLLSSSP